MNILTVIGARPQFIKAATVSRALSTTENLRETLLHTGQHYDENMSEVFFAELEIPAPEYNLGIYGGSHGEQTAKMLKKIEEVLLTEEPDIVLVYGDTNSTLAAAIAAAKLHIPIAHVEAGLRSFNKKMPEEVNRILTDHCSKYLFSPTSTATQNLLAEGMAPGNIFQVGDVMYDAILYYNSKANKLSNVLSRLGLNSKDYILATIHRAENTDDAKQLVDVFNCLEDIAKSENLVMPLHPRTRKALEAIAYFHKKRAIRFIQPVGYLDMLKLEHHAKLMITDSGGMQKEAYFQGVPCITLRNETEWTELVDHGWNILASPDSMPEAFNKALSIRIEHDTPIYGNGDAAIKIVEQLKAINTINTKKEYAKPN